MRKVALFILASTIAAAPASAAVLVDALPSGSDSYYNSWFSKTDGQNFIVQFTLASDAQIDGMSILSYAGLFAPGGNITIRLLDDVAGQPQIASLTKVDATLDSATVFDGRVYLLTSNFAPISLAAGTYWIGLSGAYADFAWSSYNDGGALTRSDQYKLSGDTLATKPGVYRLSYQLLGTMASVPEPASWALMVGGFAVMGGALRRRKMSVHFG